VTNAVLPKSDWLRSPALLRVVKALSDDGNPPHIVGGAVRDSLLGLHVTDIDLATPLLPDQVIDRLESARIKAIPTGIEHGTITAVADGETFEITTLRRDVSTDGRRATVAFSKDWKEDASRRDFTINALYADPITGEIFDYFGGLDDLKERHLRFIGDAAQRIAEDHLRILRYFRFLARFGGGRVDADAIAACTMHANSLMALSRERIASELMKILALPNPMLAAQLMIDNGIFAAFMPELANDAKSRLSTLMNREKSQGFITTPTSRLLSLLPRSAVIADKVAMRLKLSNRIRGDIADRLKDVDITPANIRSIAYHSNIECARDMAMLYADEDVLSGALAMIKGWEIPTFPLKGGDIIRRGITAGPVVAKTLKQTEKLWIEKGFPNAAHTNAMADQIVLVAISDIKNANAASDSKGRA
jgi:poly(A) polymerase